MTEEHTIGRRHVVAAALVGMAAAAGAGETASAAGTAHGGGLEASRGTLREALRDLTADVGVLRVAGFAERGDGGEGMFVRADRPAAGGIQSADGAYWHYVADADGVNARAFGAVGNGKHDDTKPVQAAIDSLANGGGIVRLTGRFLLGPLTFPARQAIILSLDGEIILAAGATLDLPPGVNLTGRGHSVNAQFSSDGIAAMVTGSETSNPVIRVAGSYGRTIENIAISPPWHVGLLLTGEPRLGALTALRNVSCVARQGVATSLPFVADTFFWVDGRDCCFLAMPGSAPYAMEFRQTLATGSYSGLARFECLRLNHGGVLISADPATNQVSSIFTFIDAQLENGAAAANMVTIENRARSFICDVTLVRPRLFDCHRDCHILAATQGHVRAVRIEGLDDNAPLLRPGPVRVDSLSVEGMRPFPYSTPIAPFAAPNAHYVRQYGSAIDARNVAAPRLPATLPLAPLAVEQDPAQWLRLANNGATVTPGVLAPDGSRKAGRVGGADGGMVVLYGRETQVTVGDWLVCGVWLQTAEPGRMPAAARLDLADGGCGLNGSNSSSVDLGRLYEPMAVADNAWKWICEAVSVTRAGSGKAFPRLYLRRDARYGETSYFMPGMLHIRPEHGFTDAEVGAMARSLVAWPSSGAAATVALLEHQLLQLGGGSRQWSSPRQPSEGDWRRGDVVWNTAPTAGGPIGWMCVSGGTPDGWRPMGRLDP